MAFRAFGIFATAAISITIVLEMAGNWRRNRDGSWHDHYLFSRGRHVRRRLVDGKWQYRAATVAEIEQRRRDEWNAS